MKRYYQIIEKGKNKKGKVTLKKNNRTSQVFKYS